MSSNVVVLVVADVVYAVVGIVLWMIKIKMIRMDESMSRMIKSRLRSRQEV
jgi:type IV secretory pathway TrbD component